ncbi:MAG TPA: hypothetical protein VGJ93_02365 [Desulfuromonadaceae bacterium]
MYLNNRWGIGERKVMSLCRQVVETTNLQSMGVGGGEFIPIRQIQDPGNDSQIFRFGCQWGGILYSPGVDSLMTKGPGLAGSPLKIASFAPFGKEGGALSHFKSTVLRNNSTSMGLAGNTNSEAAAVIDADSTRHMAT